MLLIELFFIDRSRQSSLIATREWQFNLFISALLYVFNEFWEGMRVLQWNTNFEYVLEILFFILFFLSCFFILNQ